MTTPEQVLDHLASWAEPLVRDRPFAAIYSFGSLIYRDGEEFDPRTSDIDLLAVLSDDAASPTTRTTSLVQLVPDVARLERDLTHLLGRAPTSRPITSIVAATHFEVEHDIHKSRRSGFFSKNKFRLLAGNECSFAGKPVDRCLSEVVGDAQGYRNVFLAIDSLGNRKAEPFDGEDGDDDEHYERAVPKDLARMAAQLRQLERGIDDDTRHDIGIGGLYLALLTNEAATDSEPLNRLLRTLLRRMHLQRLTEPLSIDALLLAWELVADTAIACHASRARLIGASPMPDRTAQPIPGPGLSQRTAAYMRRHYSVQPIRLEDAESAVAELRSSETSIVMDYDLDTGPREYREWVPVRPQDDDGSSWLATSRLTAPGREILRELEALVLWLRSEQDPLQTHPD